MAESINRPEGTSFYLHDGMCSCRLVIMTYELGSGRRILQQGHLACMGYQWTLDKYAELGELERQPTRSLNSLQVEQHYLNSIRKVVSFYHCITPYVMDGGKRYPLPMRLK